MNATFQWNADRTRVEVRPAAPLDPAARYLLEVGAEARDARGVALDAPRRVAFTTAAAPLAFTVTWNADRTEATITPTAPLLGGALHELALGPGARTAKGDALSPAATTFRCRTGGAITQG